MISHPRPRSFLNCSHYLHSYQYQEMHPQTPKDHVPGTTAAAGSLCGNEPNDHRSIKPTASKLYTAVPGSTKVDGVNPRLPTHPRSDQGIVHSSLIPNTRIANNHAVKGRPPQTLHSARSQPANPTKDPSAEDHTDIFSYGSTEPIEYTGRGLLPCSSFIFLAEAPPQRVGRQGRLDHRAIFAMSKREQGSRYAETFSAVSEPSFSGGRGSGLSLSVPDWAEFNNASNTRAGGKKKHRETRRKSGGRVRAWVK